MSTKMTIYNEIRDDNMDHLDSNPAAEPSEGVLAKQPGLKVYELVFYVAENDIAWFADHPERQYRARPVLSGEGVAIFFSGKGRQFSRSWLVVRRDLEYATFSPPAPPIDDEELCRLLFDAYAGLGRPGKRRLERVRQRWLSLLEGMPPGQERELARARLAGASHPEPDIRRTARRSGIGNAPLSDGHPL